MNKLIKGSLAGAAGVALLMGGFGTYATWTDSAGMQGNSISSGVMDIAAGVVVWDDLATTGTGDWTATDLLVPGDTVVRTQTFTVTGTGKSLEGTIKLTGAGVTSGGFGDLLDVKVEVTSDGNTKLTQSGNDFAFTDPFGTSILTAVVTYKFSADATAQQAQNATATVADSTITIQQTRPAAG